MKPNFLSRKKAEEAFERKRAFCSQLVRRAINQCIVCYIIFSFAQTFELKGQLLVEQKSKIDVHIKKYAKSMSALIV